MLEWRFAKIYGQGNERHALSWKTKRETQHLYLPWVMSLSHKGFLPSLHNWAKDHHLETRFSLTVTFSVSLCTPVSYLSAPAFTAPQILLGQGHHLLSGLPGAGPHQPGSFWNRSDHVMLLLRNVVTFPALLNKTLCKICMKTASPPTHAPPLIPSSSLSDFWNPWLAKDSPSDSALCSSLH